MTLRAAAGLLMFLAAHGTCWPQAATTHPPRSWMNASLSPDVRAAAVIKVNVKAVGLPGAAVATDRVERLLARPQAEHGYDLVIADQPGRTAIDFGVYGAPESFLIDAKGVIRYKHIGPLTPEVIAKELQPAIDAVKREAP